MIETHSRRRLTMERGRRAGSISLLSKVLPLATESLLLTMFLVIEVHPLLLRVLICQIQSLVLVLA